MSRQELEMRLLGQMLRHPEHGYGIVVAIESGEAVINAGTPPARRRVPLAALGEWEVLPMPSGTAPRAPGVAGAPVESAAAVPPSNERILG
jgi:hypothetical protein